jgi:type 1 glutamine amidotransferase
MTPAIGRGSRRCLILAALVLSAGTASVTAQKKNQDGVPVLLLSGGQREHHGYRDQAFYLSRFLEDTGRYRITINEDAAILESPGLSRYRAIILLTDRRDPEFKLTEDQQRALLDFVSGDPGHGLVSIHAANNAAPDWLPEMRTMLGGVFSHDTSGGRPDGKVRKGAYHVRIVRSDHPIYRGLSSFDLDDELYYHMQMEPGVELLATVAFDGTDWPVAWTRTYGKGRVFHCTLGHRDFGPDKPDPLRNPNLARLITQGLDWAVRSTPAASSPGSR